VTSPLPNDDDNELVSLMSMIGWSDATDLYVQRKGAVALVVFNRPRVLNAMTSSMAASYAAALRAADADPQVRVVVVTGAGRAFCSGADLGILSLGPSSMRAFVPSRQDLPTVAFHTV
jgi:enoyl-CoA hydratase/carnithine racemase